MTVSSSHRIGVSTVWAIGVGAALGGVFFGWQFILYGGFVSAFIALCICALFYWIYGAAVSELAARYQTSGGAFDFSYRVFGVKVAGVMAILEIAKLVLANAANALAVTSYLGIAGFSNGLRELCWIFIYTFFTILDCVGVRQSAKAQFLATLLCLAILVFYIGSSFSIFSVSNLDSAGDYSGLLGFFMGLPFALPFFDGFEEIPLLLGYAKNPEVTIPLAMWYSYATVAIFAFGVLVAGSGSTDISTLLSSEAPLMDGILAVYGSSSTISTVMTFIIVLGLLVNFFAFIVFTSQQVQSIAIAGFLPELLSWRHPFFESPIYASIFSSLFGSVLTIVMCGIFGADMTQNILITAGLLPAILGYMLLLECVVKIRQVEAEIVHVMDTVIVSTDNGDVSDSESSVKSTNLNLRDSDSYGSVNEYSKINMKALKIIHRNSALLGRDPKSLRFPLPVIWIRAAQIICCLFLIGIAVLSSSKWDYFYGIVGVCVLGIVAYFGLMDFYFKYQDYFAKSGPNMPSDDEIISSNENSFLIAPNVPPSPSRTESTNELFRDIEYLESLKDYATCQTFVEPI